MAENPCDPNLMVGHFPHDTKISVWSQHLPCGVYGEELDHEALIEGCDIKAKEMNKQIQK